MMLGARPRARAHTYTHTHMPHTCHTHTHATHTHTHAHTRTHTHTHTHTHTRHTPLHDVRRPDSKLHPLPVQRPQGPTPLPSASPRGPPCACALAPGGKLLCAGGRGEGARPRWLRDRPVQPLRLLARKTEAVLDPFVTPSTVPGSAALRQRPPSSCSTERPGLPRGACRDQGGALGAAMFLYGGSAKHAGTAWLDFEAEDGGNS